MKLENFDVTELALQEATETNGGESLWYWIAYGVGRTCSFLEQAGLVVRTGVRTYHNSKLEFGK